ncbi:MAG: pilus assembly protein [Chloroflexi bacterium]|nr:pilus assembly protein [Chloroflexota bacterium]
MEFALLLPIFLILLFAIVDFGLGLNAWITITNSAREGARTGAVGANAAAITQRVQDTSSALDMNKLTVTVTNAQGQPGGSVVVVVDYQYDLITPLSALMQFVSGNTIGPTLNLSSTADMRLE